MDDESRLDLVMCLANALLPEDAKNELIRIIQKLVGILGFVFDIVDNGIDLPGEVILYFFGWAEYQSGEGVVAPFKWWYCMFSVVMFLVAIEVFKLLAIRFIVWTKR